MVKDNLPEKIQKDENFGGYIGVEEIYNGEMAKAVDLSKFEDVIKSKGKSISFKRAHAKKIKHVLPRPSSATPTKNIKSSSGKGSSLLKSRLDNIINQIEQKSIPFHTSRREAQDLWGPNVKIVQVHVPKSRGFLQAPKTGKYFVSEEYANILKLPKIGEKINRGIKGGVGGTVVGIAKKMEKSGKICTKCGTRYKTDKCPICNKIEKPGKYQKSLLKSQAYLSVERAIHLIKGYEPMSNSAIRKAFGDQIPQQMQDEASRPPEDWWNKCMQETGDEQQCLMMWNKEASQSQAPWVEEKTDGEVEQPEQDGQSQTETDYDNLGKWMGGALQGGTLSSLLGHPIAGQAIQAAGKAIGQKILGKEVSDEEAQKIGMAAFDAIEGVINESDDDSMKKAWPALAARMIPTLARGMGPTITGNQASGIAANRAMDKRGISQKSVTHVLDKKITDEVLGKRKPETDFGGESEISGDGSKVNLSSLVERSESQDETGKSAKIDSKKIAHEYKIK